MQVLDTMFIAIMRERFERPWSAPLRISLCLSKKTAKEPTYKSITYFSFYFKLLINYINKDHTAYTRPKTAPDAPTAGALLKE